MNDARENRRLATVRRWAGLVAAVTVVAGLTACGDLLGGLVPDTQAPTLTLSGVTDGGTVVTDQVTVSAVATDDTDVTSVAFRLNGGSPQACASSGGDTYSCGPITLVAGANTIAVTAGDAAGNTTTRSIDVSYVPPGSSAFQIEIVFYDESFSANQRAAFQQAADRWESIIVGDLEGFPIDQPENGSCGQGEPAHAGIVDDLLIFATSFTDGVGGLLGSAGPCLSRLSGPDTGTNAVGTMRFDTADLADLEATDDLVETIVHEMGHVLGIGTNWEFLPYYDLLDYAPNDGAPDCRTATGFTIEPRYVGASGVAAWQDLGGAGTVPVEESGGLGTQCGHWNEETFGSELMTGYLDGAMLNPLSELTVRSLEDLGLTVDASAAEPYALPPVPGLRTQGGFDIASAETLLAPRGTIDPATGEVELFPTSAR